MIKTEPIEIKKICEVCNTVIEIVNIPNGKSILCNCGIESIIEKHYDL